MKLRKASIALSTMASLFVVTVALSAPVSATPSTAPASNLANATACVDNSADTNGDSEDSEDSQDSQDSQNGIATAADGTAVDGTFLAVDGVATSTPDATAVTEFFKSSETFAG